MYIHAYTLAIHYNKTTRNLTGWPVTSSWQLSPCTIKIMAISRKLLYEAMPHHIMFKKTTRMSLFVIHSTCSQGQRDDCLATQSWQQFSIVNFNNLNSVPYFLWSNLSIDWMVAYTSFSPSVAFSIWWCSV